MQVASEDTGHGVRRACTWPYFPNACRSVKSSPPTNLDGCLDVRALLRISRGTLHNVCKKVLLPYSREGGRLYFDAADVEAMLRNDRQVGSGK